ncbi:MAG TPA: site-2 protease family protein [Marmoricola sp.]
MVLFRVRGVPVIVGASWLLILGLVFWSLGYSVFPGSYPHLSTAAHLAMAAVGTVLFFGSVLAHELSHTLVTLREGVHVREIRLWLFGGVSAADEPLPRPGSEFRVVAAGPATTAVLGAAFLALAVLGRQLGLSGAWTGVPDYLARLNGLLLVFNLVPALPLDGGRLLHALLWWRSGDQQAATVYAGAAGRAFAFVLIAVGAVAMLTGNSFGGLWFVVIGWFLLQSVRQEVLGARATHVMGDLRVAQLMSPAPTALDPQMTIEDLAEVLGRGNGHPVYPVVSDGRLAGALVVRDAGAIPPTERRARAVASVMRTGEAVPVVTADAPASSVVTLLRKEPGRALVTDRAEGGSVIGVLAPSDLEQRLPLERSARWPGRGSRSAALIGAIATLLVLLGAAVLYHPPLVIVEPGRAVDVGAGLRVSGVPTSRLHGRYLATPVTLRQPSVLGLGLAALRGGEQVLRAGRILPVGATAAALRSAERAYARETRLAAAVAAARATGRTASLAGDGVLVVALTADLAAQRALRTGDRIVALDGVPVGTFTALAAAAARRGPGHALGRAAGGSTDLTVVRDGRRIDLRLAPGTSLLVPGVGVPALVGRTSGLRARLPFRISVSAATAQAGPSSGLALATALVDRLGSVDLARGRSVAAAGLVAGDGRVAAPGALDQRVPVAAAAHADLFLAGAPAPASISGATMPTKTVSSVRGVVRALREGLPATP